MESGVVRKQNDAAIVSHYKNGAGIINTGSGLDFNPGRQEMEQCLLVIDNRALDRECLAQSLISHNLRMEVSAVGSIDEWRREKDLHPQLSAILLNVGGRKVTDSSVANEITRLTSEFRSVPVVVLADSDDLAQILKALEYGARGYIPTSVGIDICVEAINLALAGGIFVPASSVLAMRHLIDSGSHDARPLAGMFTARQAEVVQALRRGKANKIIAYELNLRESTVKVHIRNIMKKLNATNRTEVAYKINDLFPMDSSPVGNG
jgi:DNA-binding NarL/FixJ family response regulator